MAIHPLPDEFQIKQERIALGDRALVAIAAHVEVRSELHNSSELRAHGLDDVLIGSYARRVTIWPGKDVDVFGRLTNETVDSITPDSTYDMFGRALVRFDNEGRLTPQPRSFKVDFSPKRVPGERFIRTAAMDYGWAPTRVDRVLGNLDQLAFEFSVDVVPAVIWSEHYAIPETDRREEDDQRYRTGRWRRTNPVELTQRSQRLNRDPKVAGVGAYVRTVRAVKQIKAHHLPDTKPSSFYFELILHEAFRKGAVSGHSWADIRASALAYIASRLSSALDPPVCDPVLDEPYRPAPTEQELAAAQSVFEDQARSAHRAVMTDKRCQAAIEWRGVFGSNEKHERVFPLPPGCKGTGAAMGAAAANVATGGSAERPFG
jgi:hypothetical protein